MWLVGAAAGAGSVFLKTASAPAYSASSSDPLTVFPIKPAQLSFSGSIFARSKL